jgi:hypothetical protein
MMRSFNRVLLALAAGGMLSTGCVDEETSLTITRAIPLTTVTGGCGFTPTTQLAVGNGSLDIAMADNYVLGLVIRNNMPDSLTVFGLGPEDARIDAQSVLLDGATISYSVNDQLSVNFPDSVTVPFTSFVEPNESESAVGIQIFTTSLIEELRNSPEFLSVSQTGQVRPTRSEVTIIANVTISGKMLDGTAVESNTFGFPIRVCQGCLVFYPEAAGDRCEIVPTEALEVDECLLPGQDGTIDCRLCRQFTDNAISAQLCEPPT